MRFVFPVVVVSVVACLSSPRGMAATKADAAKTSPSPSVGKVAARAINPQAKLPKFRVMSVQQLKSAQSGLARVAVRGPGRAIGEIAGMAMERVESGTASPAYASGSGVVLRPLRPYDEESGSTLILRGVAWNERVRRQVMAGDTDVSFSLALASPWLTGTNAYFQRLPSGPHTYILTIGTTAAVDRMRVRVGDRFLLPSQLVAGPAASGVRALFTYEPSGPDNYLLVIVQYLPGEGTESHVDFHHIQLVQLD
ncbi:MAG: hypothetical protein JSV65_17795 [Armatimonadota bacterium]|nr:MAG: hypothetical protein JSV65_17795 [Armatimonadota bacterium]